MLGGEGDEQPRERRQVVRLLDRQRLPHLTDEVVGGGGLEVAGCTDGGIGGGLHLGAEDVGDGGARDARARPSLGEEDAARVERVDGGAGVVHGVERGQHLEGRGVGGEVEVEVVGGGGRWGRWRWSAASTCSPNDQSTSSLGGARVLPM